MFRSLLTLALIIFAIALYFGKPDTWTWPQRGGEYTVQAINYLVIFEPFTSIVLAFLGLALFMSRRQY